MAKPEWGSKRQCPKCSTRFYDLGNDTPVMCINCDHKFKPEIILKSKQHPLEIEEPEDNQDDEDDEEDLLLNDEDLLKEEDDAVTIDEDDNTTILSDDDDNDVTGVVDAPVKKKSTD